jgi:deoxyribodipyrimidine photo-lyase
MPAADSALVWFRRDLRDHDHAPLHQALAEAGKVHCVFVFDADILDALDDRADRRVEFIHGSVTELDAALRQRGGGLRVLHGRARDLIPRLARELGVQSVFWGRDYEPAARDRDAEVIARLQQTGIEPRPVKEHVIFERDEVLTQAGRPFTVFTPYKNAWLKRLRGAEPPLLDVAAFPVEPRPDQLQPPPADACIPTLAEMGFLATDSAALGIRPGMSGGRERLADFAQRIGGYKERRDFPAVKGVSYLSVHLRFGTVSIRECARLALGLARADPGSTGGSADLAMPSPAHPMSEGHTGWLNELIWRDFYFAILHHFPHAACEPFKPEYAALVTDQDAARLAAWQDGRTGYPLVDAAMRQLNTTGYMHNRLRMVTASFLTKHLLLDWRLGETYFARKLIDFDQSANNGGWQWAASTGCDAQPYFRIFNPISQSERFDAEGRFIRRYVPELCKVPTRYIHAPWTLPPLEAQSCGFVVGRDYPAPIVDHATQRAEALRRYAAVAKSRS